MGKHEALKVEFEAKNQINLPKEIKLPEIFTNSNFIHIKMFHFFTALNKVVH